MEQMLVAKVILLNKVNEDRDYRYKRSEYAARGIVEYWIVDPAREQVTLLTLVDGFYEATVFKNSESIISPTFPNLNLTSAQIFSTGYL